MGRKCPGGQGRELLSELGLPSGVPTSSYLGWPLTQMGSSSSLLGLENVPILSSFSCSSLPVWLLPKAGLTDSSGLGQGQGPLLTRLPSFTLIYGAEVHFLSVPQFPAAALPADQSILSTHDMLYGKQESASSEDQTGPLWGPGTAGLRQGRIGPSVLSLPYQSICCLAAVISLLKDGDLKGAVVAPDQATELNPEDLCK